MNRKSSDISLSKFIDFVLSKSYSPVSIYHIGDKVVFIEVRTPKMQRSFIIHVDGKYSMRYNNDRYRSFEIFPAKQDLESLEDLYVQYMKDIKGNLLSCDVLSISSDRITLLKNNEKVETYTFECGARDDEAEGAEDDDDIHVAATPYEKLEKDSERLASIIEEGDANDVEGDTAVDGDDAVEDPQIELEFVDADVEEESGDNEEEDDEEVFVQSTYSLEKRVDNSIPEDIEGSNVDYGILYFSTDLSTFYQRLRIEGGGTRQSKAEDWRMPLEEEILTAYDTMDDNEADMRSSKLDEIQELCSKISSKAKHLVEGYQTRELDLKSQVLKLSVVLEKAENLKVKTSDKKFAEERPNVDRLYNQTKTSLYDLNVEIAQNKDCINDLLNVYISSLTYLSTEDI